MPSIDYFAVLSFSIFSSPDFPLSFIYIFHDISFFIFSCRFTLSRLIELLIASSISPSYDISIMPAIRCFMPPLLLLF